MKVYTVSHSFEDVQYSSYEIEKKGCFVIREKAIKRARSEFDKLRERYASEIAEYSDINKYPEEAEGSLYMCIDDEFGYYCMAFGCPEKREIYAVYVDEWEVE